MLQYHIEKKADVTMVVKKLDNRADIGRYGVVALAEDGRITDIDEKPLETNLSTCINRYICSKKTFFLLNCLKRQQEKTGMILSGIYL